MRIAQAAKISGLSTDTIRFYEREGLLGAIDRSAEGHRQFSAQDLKWLRLFERLRTTGMPLADMKQYAKLAEEGDRTLAHRRQILQHHRQRLVDQQAAIEACRALIDQKIDTYKALERTVDV